MCFSLDKAVRHHEPNGIWLDAVNACGAFVRDHRLLAEPACDGSLTAVYGAVDYLRDKANMLWRARGDHEATPGVVGI